VPPLAPASSEEAGEGRAPPAPRALSAEDACFVQSLVLHRDASVIVLNKPAGLAVQGGTKTARHLDAMLDALRFDAPERPRLVHRLDRDTSGVLVLGRGAAAAARLAAAFRHKGAHKLYWALVAGVPRPSQGEIRAALAKLGGQGERAPIERVVAVAQEDERGRPAVSRYAVIERAGQKAAWLALTPLTGRTHQLRVHCALIGTPIVGDGKYGGEAARLGGVIPDKLHLHARALSLPHPEGGMLRVRAPLPPHMQETWRIFGFDPDAAADPFPEAG
jgi:23S rRNA pseudouridine955/2504/2580 synthase